MIEPMWLLKDKKKGIFTFTSYNFHNTDSNYDTQNHDLCDLQLLDEWNKYTIPTNIQYCKYMELEVFVKGPHILGCHVYISILEIFGAFWFEPRPLEHA